MDIPAEDAAVASAFERLYAAFRRITPREQLSLTAASTLARLERHGPQRLCDLHAPEGVTQPAMTQLITRLERDGLASRGSDPADGRAVLVSVTDAGREAVARRRAARATAISAVLRKLPEEDRAVITAALPALDHVSELLP
ncbi:MarR family transcriptional regulator [Actinoplanes sp. OR16]|uniref:MarR family winged helix-turn-helix transcriptional regulator n=1 Tax=Actinoplanes sp. OR16 TaxID=946334 RepID=UPI000F6E55A3|nr:MarR family transcriptional regulator [Actinoplanes sp. OR16]BBH65838.1 MarR family transcriptional regulator [Actinoplanes sp. OR16]